jgi:hypothetical protein
MTGKEKQQRAVFTASAFAFASASAFLVVIPERGPRPAGWLGWRRESALWAARTLFTPARGRIFLRETGAPVEIVVAISGALPLNKRALPTYRSGFLRKGRRRLWGNGKTPDAIQPGTPDVQALRFRGNGFGKLEPRFFRHIDASGRLIHSSTPNDYDYGLLSIFKT